MANPDRNYMLFTLNGKAVAATRYDKRESSVPGAENWGYRVVGGSGLDDAEVAEVHRRLRRAERRRIGSNDADD